MYRFTEGFVYHRTATDVVGGFSIRPESTGVVETLQILGLSGHCHTQSFPVIPYLQWQALSIMVETLAGMSIASLACLILQVCQVAQACSWLKVIILHHMS